MTGYMERLRNKMKKGNSDKEKRKERKRNGIINKW